MTKTTGSNRLTLGQQLSPEKKAELERLLGGKKQPSEAKAKVDKSNDHNQQAIEAKKEKIKNALNWLYETFPDCFNWEAPKPLKLKIELEIFTLLTPETPTKTAVRRAIEYYTSSTRYLKATIQNEKRFDLKGLETDDCIDESHKQYAQDIIDRRKKRNAKPKVNSNKTAAD